MFHLRQRYKTIVVGDGKVGKTSLLYAKLYGNFHETAVPITAQLETYQAIDMEVDGKKLELINWELVHFDSDDDIFYNRFKPLMYSGGNAILLCFDIGDRETLSSLSEKAKILVYAPHVPIVVVGLKADTRTGIAVTEEEGKAMAKIVGAFAYVECSAKTKDGIDQVFEEVARAVWSRHHQSKRNCILI